MSEQFIGVWGMSSSEVANKMNEKAKEGYKFLATIGGDNYAVLMVLAEPPKPNTPTRNWGTFKRAVASGATLNNERTGKQLSLVGDTWQVTGSGIPTERRLLFNEAVNVLNYSDEDEIPF